MYTYVFKLLSLLVLLYLYCIDVLARSLCGPAGAGGPDDNDNIIDNNIIYIYIIHMYIYIERERGRER